MGEVLLPGLTIVHRTDYGLLCLFACLLCVGKEFLYSYRLHLLRRQSRHRSARKSSRASIGDAATTVAVGFESDAHSDHHEPTAPLITASPSSSSPFSSSAITPYLPSLLYALNTSLSYVVMLLVMTYNVGLFAIIVLSTAAAHYAFDSAHRTQKDNGHAGDPRAGKKMRDQVGLTRRASGGETREGRGGGRGEKGSAAPMTDDDLDEDELLAKDCCEK